MIPAADFGELAVRLTKAAKPLAQMSKVELAEFKLLEALVKLEGLKADLIYAEVLETA